jgi:C-type lysozyme/alpha-lactalbumin family
VIEICLFCPQKGVCLVRWESNFNTSAIGSLNGDGSLDHGLFQISDNFWCNGASGRGEACGLDCHRKSLLYSSLSAPVQLKQ